MQISERLLVGTLVEHEVESIIAQLTAPVRKKEDAKKASGLWFVITTCPEADELLYVLSSGECKSRMYQHMSLKALGIAGSRAEAFELVRQLVDSGYREGMLKAGGLKSYLNDY